MTADASASWPRKWGWSRVAIVVVIGGIIEFSILLPYAQLVGKPPVWLIFSLNSLWTIAAGLAVRGARTRICPFCGKQARRAGFSIGRRTCDRCGANVQ